MVAYGTMRMSRVEPKSVRCPRNREAREAVTGHTETKTVPMTTRVESAKLFHRYLATPSPYVASLAKLSREKLCGNQVGGCWLASAGDRSN